MSLCIICDHGAPVEEYSLPALLINKDLFKMCPEHTREVEQRIIFLEKEEPKKFVLKTGEPVKTFIPKPVEVRPNFQDREPGCDDN